MIINTPFCQSVLVGLALNHSGRSTVLNCSLQNVVMHIWLYITEDIVSKNAYIRL